MSATNRGAVRNEHDNYPTPAWCVRVLLEALQLPGGNWLEPACGEGAIVRAVNEVREDVRWDCIDIRPAAVQAVRDLPGVSYAGAFDFIGYGPARKCEVAITNPPYSLALEFAQTLVGSVPVVAMLLRLNWLASQKRAPWLKANMPDVYVLSRRPSFTEKGTDATDYAWMVWGPTPQTSGRVQILEAGK